MKTPTPRGPLSSLVVSALAGPPGPLPAADLARSTPDDEALALWVLHELHYRGFDGVDDRWEWEPSLMPLRRRLEDDLESRLRSRWEEAGRPGAGDGTDVASALFALVDDDDGPSLARHLQRHGSRAEAEELLAERSLYHLKEADPTAWVVPRLSAAPKAALMEVQYDEYGNGQPQRLHHRLFQRGLEASGIDASYGAHVDRTRLAVLEQNNAMSMFGLQRRLRGAALGHLAAFEASSSLPSRQLAQALGRLGFPAEMVGYYDEHVEADAVHEQLAARAICGALVAEEPGLRDDVLLGAWTCLDLEARTAASFLTSWQVAA